MTTCPRCEMPNHAALSYPDWRGFVSCKSSECPMRTPVDIHPIVQDAIRRAGDSVMAMMNTDPLSNYIRSAPAMPQKSRSVLYYNSIAALLTIYDTQYEPQCEQKYYDQLLENGLIAQEVLGKYKVTDRGRAFVEAIMALPLPVATWSMPKS